MKNIYNYQLPGSTFSFFADDLVDKFYFSAFHHRRYPVCNANSPSITGKVYYFNHYKFLLDTSVLSNQIYISIGDLYHIHILFVWLSFTLNCI